MGFAWGSLVTPCFSFFSLTFFFRLISWSIEAPCVHLSAQVSKTWKGRCSVSSLPRETGKTPVASVNRANFLSRSFIGFICKPRNISLFLSSIFLSTIFFPYFSLNQPLMPFFLQVPLDPAGDGTRQFPHLYPRKWWDWMLWSSFFECWVLNQFFHSPLTLSSRGSSVLRSLP